MTTFALGSISLNGKELGRGAIGLILPDPSAEEVARFEAGWRGWQQFRENIVGKTVTLSCSFTPSPEFWGIIVGLQLQYGLRQLHQNLGRYCSWPYTN